MRFILIMRIAGELYEHAREFAADGIHLISTDEMTGIQALERAAPTQAMRPGKLKRQEFEYIRHGTLSLIAIPKSSLARL